MKTKTDEGCLLGSEQDVLPSKNLEPSATTLREGWLQSGCVRLLL